MRTAFVKTASFFLLLCITLHTTGLYLVFYVLQSEWKVEMKRELSKEVNHKNVIALTMNKSNASDFVFEGRDEFTYQGKMYDVIRKDKKGNKIIFYCIDDKKETGLVQAYLQKQNAEKNKARMQQAGQFLTELYVDTNHTEFLKIEPLFLEHQSFYQFVYTEKKAAIVIPPPRIIA